MLRQLLPCVLLLAVSSATFAHDTWVQTNTNLVRVGDAVHIDLMLGNHGNNHRDFKLASKINLDGSQLAVRAPDGKRYDLLNQLVDTGYAPKEGFWTTRFVAGAPGPYIIEHSLDQVVNHGRPVRAVKSSKTLFLASRLLDKVDSDTKGFEIRSGHPLELVPHTNPVAPMGPGIPISVTLYFKGKPRPDTRVSFIPRGEELKADFDERYERLTDAAGQASFTPRTGNYYLVVAHVSAPEERTDDYDSTHYGATLIVYVPELCPCCGE